MDNFSFNPSNVFKDASVFTDPGTEEETRNQLSAPHEQTRNYINTNIVPTLNQAVNDIADLQSDVEGLIGATGDPEALQELLDAIDEIKDFLAVADTVVYVGDV